MTRLKTTAKCDIFSVNERQKRIYKAMNNMKTGPLVIILILLFSVVLLTACSVEKDTPLSETANVNIWYARDNSMAENFGSCVGQFNKEKGAELNVSVTIKPFQDERALLTAVENAIENNGELPQIIMCSPDLSAYLMKNGKLTDSELYQQSLKISDYSDELIKACTCGDKLICVPIAAESDVMMINTAKYSDVEKLDSLEKLCTAANNYYGENGEYFFTVTDFSAFFNSAMAQLGEQFKAENPFEYENDNVRYIYDQLATAAFKRGYTAADANPAETVAEGELVCAVVSAGAVMTAKADMSDVEFMPCPPMKDGKAVYVQRVTAMSVLKSDENTEAGAAIFLKWFTSEEINSAYVGFSGFVPASGSVGGTSNAEAPAVYSKLMNAVNSMDYYVYNANADFALKSVDFNSIMDNIMKKSLS